MTVAAPRRRRGRTVTVRERTAGGGRGSGGGRERAVDPTLFDDGCTGPVDRAPTLDELVTGTWAGLVAHQQVPCPVCGGEMTSAETAHAQASLGRCADCGTTLG